MAVGAAVSRGLTGRLNDGRTIVLAPRSAYRMPQGTVIGPGSDGTAP